MFCPSSSPSFSPWARRAVDQECLQVRVEWRAWHIAHSYLWPSCLRREAQNQQVTPFQIRWGQEGLWIPQKRWWQQLQEGSLFHSHRVNLHRVRCPFQTVRHRVSLPLSPSAPSVPLAWRVELLELWLLESEGDSKGVSGQWVSSCTLAGTFGRRWSWCLLKGKRTR